MTLPEKIKLIDALIRENPETTIKEYLEDLYEIERIERKTTQPCHSENTPKTTTVELRICGIAV